MKFRGGAIQFFGTKRHHDKWLRETENYAIKGCFAMSELGHGSNVCHLTFFFFFLNKFFVKIVCHLVYKQQNCSGVFVHIFLSFSDVL